MLCRLMKSSSRKKATQEVRIVVFAGIKIVSIIHCRAFRGADSSPSMESCRKTFSAASRGIYNCCCYVVLTPNMEFPQKKRRNVVEVHIGGCTEVTWMLVGDDGGWKSINESFLRKLDGFAFLKTFLGFPWSFLCTLWLLWNFKTL